MTVEALPLDALPLDALIESKASIENEIQRRVSVELAELNARRATLLALLEDAPCAPVNMPATAPAVSCPKYRDPETGKTWSGRGKRPGWFDINRAEDFMIHPC